MILIIDGYNLLKQIIKAKFASEQQVKWLISKLVAYRKIKGHKIIIVFDGEDHFFIRTKESEIKIIYSGKNISADKYINLYIEQNKSPNLGVISSDNVICSYALKRNIGCIDSITFSKKLLQEQKEPEKIYIKKALGQASKLSEKSENPELDKLMQEASEYIMIKDEVGEDLKHKTAKSKTLSKQERDLLNILKKL